MDWIQTAVKDSGAEGGNSRYRNSSADAENARGEGLIPGSERSPAGGNGYWLQHSCLEVSWTEEPGGLQSIESQKSLQETSLNRQSYFYTPACIHWKHLFWHGFLFFQIYFYYYIFFLVDAVITHTFTRIRNLGAILDSSAPHLSHSISSTMFTSFSILTPLSKPLRVLLSTAQRFGWGGWGSSAFQPVRLHSPRGHFS